MKRRRSLACFKFRPHLSPLGWEHINLTGDYLWDLRQTTTLERLRTLNRNSGRTTVDAPRHLSNRLGSR